MLSNSKARGERSDYTVGLQSRAQVSWTLAARQSQSLQMSWTLSCSCCLPQNPPTWTNFIGSNWWTLMTRIPLMKRTHSISKQYSWYKQICKKLSHGVKKRLECRKHAWYSFTGALWKGTRKIALAPAVQQQCMFGQTCQHAIIGNWTTFGKP